MNNKNFTLDEASLGRVYQHVTGEKGIRSWGMITAYRGVNSKKENITANKKLKSDIRSENLGYFEVEGHWRECQDPNIDYNDCPKEKLKDSVEVSLFVPGISRDVIAKLCKEYGQDAVVYSGPETEGKVVLIFKNGGTTVVGNKFAPNQVAQAYSVVKNRSFLFREQSLLRNLIPIGRK
jgi:hypothetical protein